MKRVIVDAAGIGLFTVSFPNEGEPTVTIGEPAAPRVRHKPRLAGPIDFLEAAESLNKPGKTGANYYLWLTGHAEQFGIHPLKDGIKLSELIQLIPKSRTVREMAKSGTIAELRWSILQRVIETSQARGK